MGEVYEARDEALGEAVALKIVRREMAREIGVEQFLDEVRNAKRVTHRNVCRIYDLFQHESGEWFVTMELLPGRTLLDEIRSRGRFSVADALPAVIDMATALDAAHQEQIIHRDFKSANVMLVPRGGRTQAVVMDFGLARRVTSARPDTVMTIAGTPAYMAPEQLAGSGVTPRADIYALGVVMYEMVAGRRPFQGRPFEAVLVGERAPSPRTFAPDLDPRWEAVILRCLEHDAQLRPATAGEVAAALQAPLPVRKSGMKAVTATVGAAAAVSLLAVTAVVMRLGGPGEAPPSPEARAHYERGLGYLREGTYYAAAKALQKAVETSPYFRLAHAGLAEAWMELDWTERANQAVVRAMKPGARLSSSDQARLDAVLLTLNRDRSGAVAAYRRIADGASRENRPGALLDLGRAAERNYDTALAAECYEQAARLGDLPGAHLLLGVLLARQGNGARAAEEWAKAESQYDATSNFEGKTEVYYQRASYAMSRPGDAKRWLEVALRTARGTGNAHQQIRALSKLSNFAEDAVAGEKLAAEALALARETGVESLRGRALIDLANAASLRRDGPKVNEYAGEALRVAGSISSERLEAASRLLLGAAAVDANAPSAAAHLEAARNFYERAGFRREAISASNLLVRVRRNRRQFEAALDDFGKILEQARAIGDRALEATAQHDIGRVLSDIERYPEALSRYSESVRLWKETGREDFEAFATVSVATACWRLGRYAEANQLLDRATEISRARKLDSLAASVFRSRADMALSRNLYRDAIAWARRSQGSKPTNATAADATRVLCLAQARSGAAREAEQNCQEAAKLAAATADRDLSTQVKLAQLEAWMAGGRILVDVADAGRAAAEMKAEGRLDSSWRTLYLAARVHAKRGDRGEAARKAAEAVEILTALKEKWGPAYTSYEARQDIADAKKSLVALKAK